MARNKPSRLDQRVNPRARSLEASPVRHNIWEIVVHCAYWKYIVRRRLLAEKKGSFPLKGSNWFKCPMVATEKAWRADIALLEETHRSMRDAIAGLTSSDLKKYPTGGIWTTMQTISGAASHDLYHAGQIQLLKRLQKEKIESCEKLSLAKPLASYPFGKRREDSVLESRCGVASLPEQHFWDY